MCVNACWCFTSSQGLFEWRMDNGAWKCQQWWLEVHLLQVIVKVHSYNVQIHWEKLITLTKGRNSVMHMMTDSGICRWKPREAKYIQGTASCPAPPLPQGRWFGCAPAFGLKSVDVVRSTVHFHPRCIPLFPLSHLFLYPCLELIPRWIHCSHHNCYLTLKTASVVKSWGVSQTNVPVWQQSVLHRQINHLVCFHASRLKLLITGTENLRCNFLNLVLLLKELGLSSAACGHWLFRGKRTVMVEVPCVTGSGPSKQRPGELSVRSFQTPDSVPLYPHSLICKRNQVKMVLRIISCPFSCTMNQSLESIM